MPFNVTIHLLIASLFAAGCGALAGAAPSEDGRGARRASVLGRHSAHRPKTDVYYARQMADNLAKFSEHHRGSVNGYIFGEQSRLEEAMAAAPASEDRDLLEAATAGNEAARLEAANAFNELDSLVTTLKHAMGAVGPASCSELSCGTHAYCREDRPGQGRCLCKEGFQGDGFVCKVPLVFAEHSLLSAPPHQGPERRVADLHVSTTLGNGVAVVFRDTSQANRGFLMFGKAGPAGMTWSEPVAFTNETQAFSPAFVELQGGSGGFAITYRDRNRGGSGMLLGGMRDTATGKVSFGPAKVFAHHQAQTSALLPLPSSQVAVIFAEHVVPLAAGESAAARRVLTSGPMYGSAVLARILDDAAPPELLGKYRFAGGPVTRISAAMLSPRSFVLGFRRGERWGEAKTAEASCTFAQLHDGQLIFDTHPLSLEADRTEIWARSVAPIRSDVFAYTYHSGMEQVTKQAILRVDPVTHRVAVLRKPEVLAKGFTPYVGSASTAVALPEHELPEQRALLQVQGPRLLTYYSAGGSARAQAHICRFGADGTPSGCQDVSLSDREVVSVSSAPLGDGRLLVAFTDSRGIPYYQLVGLMGPASADMDVDVDTA